MTAPPPRSTPRLPASQATAPVAEFRCLFTHDIRRKQKRWQDGFLKFHSFNSRVMVYDTARNFLGDTYRKDTSALQEGDELTLDKGVMVEVADAMGVTQTDLTPLFEKKSPAKVATSKPLPRPSAPLTSVPRTGSQLRHRSLNNLLGTPRGPIGKAIPIQSPYEVKQDTDNERYPVMRRAAKRQKITHVAPVSSPVRSRCPPGKSDVIPAAAASTPQRNPPAALKPMSQGAIVIELLDSEPDCVTSDIIEVTPPHATFSVQEGQVFPEVSPSAPRFIVSKRDVPTSEMLRDKAPFPPSNTKSMATNLTEYPSSPPVSMSNRLPNLTKVQKSTRRKLQVLPRATSPPRDPRAKSLRLVTGSKRGMLLCESLAQKRVRRQAEHPKQSEVQAKSKSKVRHQASSCELVPCALGEDEPFEPANTIGSVSLSKRPNQKGTRKQLLTESSVTKKSGTASAASEPSQDGFEDMELLDRIMDEQMLPLKHSTCADPSQSTTHCMAWPLRPDIPMSERSTEKRCLVRGIGSPEMTEIVSTEKSKELGFGPLSGGHAHKELRRIDQLNTGNPERPRSLGSSITEEPISRPIASSSNSARSTSGFSKEPKRTQAAAHMPTLVSTEKGSTSSLPRPSLRANQDPTFTGPSKLSTLLMKQQGSAQPGNDPIEDDTQSARHASPSRSFRRVRSENDAPNLSTSAEWDLKDLPSSHVHERAIVEELAASKLATSSRVGGLAALIKQTDPRRKFQRTQSLTIQPGASAAFGHEAIPSPPLDTDIGPWSTEAYDLFDWRPPVQKMEMKVRGC